MIIGAYSVLNKNPGRAFAGSTVSGLKGSWRKSGAARGIFYPSGVATNPNYKYGVPNGYRPPYSWVIAQKDGGMASTNLLEGVGALDITSLAGGLNAVATLAGVGSLAATGALIVSAVATLTGTGAVTGTLLGKLNAVATLAGTGNVAGSLKALGNTVATLNGIGSVTGTRYAIGHMEAELTPFTELSPENLAAAVWNAIAVVYNDVGTMGEKMNDAGSGGDPWATDLTAYTTTGTAGKVLKDKLSKGQFIALK